MVAEGSLGFLLIFVVGILALSIRIVRPRQRGLIERFGKFHKYEQAGIKFLIPFIDKLIRVNITEQMVDIDSQSIITKDNLNATVAAQVYFKVNDTEDGVKNSQYKVDAVGHQIVALSQTTLRNIIGTMTLTEANTDRSKINTDLEKKISSETSNWGISVIRTELREIDPPSDVQEAMNNVVKAENEKIAAKDYATATEIAADGKRRASIKEAEGEKEAIVLKAEAGKEALILDGVGRAERIKEIYVAADKHFVGNGQLLRRLEVTENALEKNSVLVIPEGQQLVNVIGDMSGVKVLPLSDLKTKKLEKAESEKK